VLTAAAQRHPLAVRPARTLTRRNWGAQPLRDFDLCKARFPAGLNQSSAEPFVGFLVGVVSYIHADRYIQFLTYSPNGEFWIT